jgi:hypothetical protein
MAGRSTAEICSMRAYKLIPNEMGTGSMAVESDWDIGSTASSSALSNDWYSLRTTKSIPKLDAGRKWLVKFGTYREVPSSARRLMKAAELLVHMKHFKTGMAIDDDVRDMVPKASLQEHEFCD